MLIATLGLLGHNNGYWATVAMIYNNIMKVAKKIEGVPVVNPGLGFTVETEEFQIVKPIDTWAEVSPSTTSNPN
jgi:hypothetical protein